MADDGMPELFEYTLKLSGARSSPLLVCPSEKAFNWALTAVYLWQKEPDGTYEGEPVDPVEGSKRCVAVPVALTFCRDPHLMVTYDIADRLGGSNQYAAECSFSGGTGELELRARDPNDKRVVGTVHNRNLLLIEGTFPGKTKRLLVRVQLLKGSES